MYAPHERGAGGAQPMLHVAAGAFPALASAASQWSASADRLNQNADRFVEGLCGASDGARNLIRRSRAVLFFPCVGAAGLLPGGQQGEGVMWIGGASAAYYRIIAAARSDEGGEVLGFGLAFFFVDRAALSGSELGGADACLVVPGIPHAPIASGSDLRQSAFAIPFGQRGLISSLGLEGSRIFRIHPPH